MWRFCLTQITAPFDLGAAHVDDEVLVALRPTRVKFILYFSYLTLYCRAIVYLSFDDRYRNIRQSFSFFYM